MQKYVQHHPLQALAMADPVELAQLPRVNLARATRWVTSAQQVANTPLDPSVPITTSFIGRVTPPPPPASESVSSIIEASPSATVIPPNMPTASRPMGEPFAPRPSQPEASSTPAPTPSIIEGSESPPPSVVTRNNLPPTSVDGDRS